MGDLSCVYNIRAWMQLLILLSDQLSYSRHTADEAWYVLAKHVLQRMTCILLGLPLVHCLFMHYMIYRYVEFQTASSIPNNYKASKYQSSGKPTLSFHATLQQTWFLTFHFPNTQILPVQTPVACSSSPLTHVFPLPGKLTSATGARFVPFIK